MLNSVILDGREQEYVVRAIESSLHVTRKHQLYLWTQGLFHGLVPHDVLVGLQLDESGKSLHIECITSTLLDSDIHQLVCDPITGIAVRLARGCQESDTTLPMMLPEVGEESMERQRMLNEVKRCGLACALVHGRQSTRGGGWDYFVLFSKEALPNVRHGYFMQILLPHLHSAFQRATTPHIMTLAEPQGRSGKLLTDRELEIMSWVRQGKSNQDIGTILGISQLTVKNHVQNILKKLKVQNRTQAVSQAIALRLLNKTQ